MHIQAVSVEPEFVTVESIGGGAIDINIELARFSVTEANELKHGSLRLSLLAADVGTLTLGLGKLLDEARHSIKAES